MIALVKAYVPRTNRVGHAPEETYGTQAPTFVCSYPECANARWALQPIQHLLRVQERELGEPLEGCVESLNTEYSSYGGFVWGYGVDPRNSRLVSARLSIVVASYEFESASIYLAPAITPMEKVIRTYHDVGDRSPGPLRCRIRRLLPRGHHRRRDVRSAAPSLRES